MMNKLRYFSDLATYALTKEINLSPKPGLVDRYDSGAHADMDRRTFLQSIKALSPSFHRYLLIGYDTASQAPRQTFDQLRAQGQVAEAEMFLATQGVNTHKGINFLMAVLLGALGHYLQDRPDLLTVPHRWTPADSQAICQGAIPLTSHLDQTDWDQVHLKDPSLLTHGEKLYLAHGIKGPRGTVMDGFSSIWQDSLPFLRAQAAQDPDFTRTQLKTLLYLMSQVEDGNLIHRGGIQAWQQVKQDAGQLLRQSDQANWMMQLAHYNQTLIDRHLSPGGAADLLSITLFLASLEGIPNKHA